MSGEVTNTVAVDEDMAGEIAGTLSRDRGTISKSRDQLQSTNICVIARLYSACLKH